MINFNEIKWGQNKILPIIAQELKTKILMLLINLQALQKRYQADMFTIDQIAKMYLEKR